MSENQYSASQIPNFFVVGAAKAGTTSLYEYLRQHPEVFMSPVKEPHYFSNIQPTPELRAFYRHIADRKAYLNLFADRMHERLVGEASTSYLWDAGAAKRIQEFNPAAKIVIMVRDPVERAFSHYLNDVREGVEKMSFSDALAQEAGLENKGWGRTRVYIDAGYYTDAVQRYYELFGNNVHLIVFEDLVRDTIGCLKKLFRFLEIDDGMADSIKPEVHNPFSMPRGALSRSIMGSERMRNLARMLVPGGLRAFLIKRVLLEPVQKPILTETDRKTLRDLYKCDVENLLQLLGRTLPWKNFERS